MSESNTLPDFDSVEHIVEFFDTHDMGEYDLPEVEFDVDKGAHFWCLSIRR